MDAPTVCRLPVVAAGPRSLVRPPMLENRVLHRDLFALALLAFTVFLGVAVATYNVADPVGERLGPLAQWYTPDQLVYPAATKVTNACGRWGALAASLLLTALGVGGYYAVGSLAILVATLLRRQSVDGPLLRLIGWIASLVGMTTLAAILLPEWSPGPMTGAGGALGALGAGLLHHHFALTGSIILASGVALGGLMLCSDYLLMRLFGSLFAALVWLVRGSRRAAPATPVPAPAAKGSARKKGAAARAVSADPELGAAAGDDAKDAEEEEEDGDEQRHILPIRIRKKAVAGAVDEEEDDEDEDERLDDEDDADEADEDDDADDEDADDDELDDELEDEDDEPAARPKRGAAAKGAAAVASGNAPGSHPHFKVKKNSEQSTARDEVIAELEQSGEVEAAPEYELPGVDLLVKGEDLNWEAQEKEVRRKAKILEKTFADFGFKVRVVEIETGPVIAQYEVELEAGLRLSKITALADDLAIALRVPSVRIVAPIPGKNTVGIEVPNEERQVVRLREVIEETNGKIKKMRVPLFLGKDVSGNALTVDLSTLPHLLIAGRTGTGKSVCLNAIISSILMTRRPDEVRLIMIDPKMVELSGYGRLPHLMHPVVTDMRKAEAILAWAVEKMEERYTLLARAGVRHISSYNQLGEAELLERLQPEDDDARKAIPRQLPFIVIVADEIADMMMTAGKEVEQHIIRLAQKSRAVGIHLILATQKPTVDVITGLIKSNLPARISFQVASRTDSRVVLDEMGADKLLGNGDMLFLWPGTSTLLRGQGTYLGDDEINRIVDCCSKGRPQNFVSELVNIKVNEGEEGGRLAQLKKRDELYESAVDVVVREGRGSVSLLQRALGIGYGRAARLIDFMAEDGIVGQYNGSQARDVLLSIEDWEQMQREDRGGSGGDSDDDPPPTPAKRRPVRIQPAAEGPPPSRRGPAREEASRSPLVSAPTLRSPEPDFDNEDSEEDSYEVPAAETVLAGADARQRIDPANPTASPSHRRSATTAAARRGIISLVRPADDAAGSTDSESADPDDPQVSPPDTESVPNSTRRLAVAPWDGDDDAEELEDAQPT